jgi:hypothetical protein
MLFYQFIISRNSAPWQPSSSLTIARVMLRNDGDVESSTDAAVKYLEARGWHIEAVRHAQQAESMTDFAEDDAPLFREASERGIACQIREIEEHAFAGA